MFLQFAPAVVRKWYIWMGCMSFIVWIRCWFTLGLMYFNQIVYTKKCVNILVFIWRSYMESKMFKEFILNKWGMHFHICTKWPIVVLCLNWCTGYVVPIESGPLVASSRLLSPEMSRAVRLSNTSLKYISNNREGHEMSLTVCVWCVRSSINLFKERTFVEKYSYARVEFILYVGVIPKAIIKWFSFLKMTANVLIQV